MDDKLAKKAKELGGIIAAELAADDFEHEISKYCDEKFYWFLKGGANVLSLLEETPDELLADGSREYYKAMNLFWGYRDSNLENVYRHAKGKFIREEIEEWYEITNIAEEQANDNDSLRIYEYFWVNFEIVYFNDLRLYWQGHIETLAETEGLL